MAVNFSNKATGKYSGQIPDYVETTVDDRKRVLLYDVYWRFYLGRHWRYAAEEGVPQLTFNYCKAFVDKSVAFLTGGSFKINAPEEVKDITEEALNRVWDDNDRGLLLLELAQSGAVTGDIWIKVGYDDDAKRVVLSIVNPSTVFPKFNKYDTKKIDEVSIAGQLTDEIGEKHTYQEIIAKDEIVEFYDAEEIEGSRRENVLGELPIVHIKNLPIPHSFFGLSDLTAIVPLNKEFNEKATDLSDTINYQGSPVVIIKGAKSRNLERGANRVWGGLPRDASVSTLSIGGALSENAKYLDTLKQAMHELSGVPEATLGKMQPISNTSGSALHIQYQPLMEKTKVKRLTYGNGLRAVNRLILKTLEIKEGLKIPDSLDKYNSEIIFQDPMPKDRTIELQNAQMELNMGIASKKEIAERLGKDKVDELLEQAKKDNIEDQSTPFTSSQMPYPEEE